MICVLNASLTLEAVLEKATGIEIAHVLNDVSALTFSIPYNDPKRAYLQPFTYIAVTNEAGIRTGLFRVLPVTGKLDASGGMLTVTCEHVIATLLDDALPGWHQFGGEGLFTRDTIEYVLSFQTTQRWVLGDCEFYDQYEYGWQHEKCLTALSAITEPITLFKWEYDVSGFPWVMHLRRIDLSTPPEFRAAYGYNRVSVERTVDPSSLVTRLYCYGYGEGVNQMDISSVNGGKPYIDAPEPVKALFGVKCGYYVARDIEDVATLLAAGQAVLSEAMYPKVTYKGSAADLFEATKNELDRPAVGKVALLLDADYGNLTTHITAVKERPGSTSAVDIELSNRTGDIANTIAKIADRQRVEQTYAQGATQLFAFCAQANASPAKGAVLLFYAPEQLRRINAVQIKVTLEKFRAYSQATDGGGGKAITAENAQTNLVVIPEKLSGLQTGSASGSGSHRHSLPDLTYAPQVTDPGHTHQIELPGHKHDITPGIYEYGNPTGAVIKVNNNQVGTMEKAVEMDISAALVSGGSIPRGSWQRLEIMPNDLAYVTISLIFQGFVQSRGGGVY